MKTQELRIGNWIKGDADIPYEFELSDFSDWYNDHNSHEFGDHIHPIPLTEEWLLKFGVKKENVKPDSEHHGSYFSMAVYDYKYSFAYADFRDDWGFYHSYTDACDEKDNNKFDFISCGIKYVHQLQNLYFALIGEELIINQ